ncbi:hypothetical protein ABI59_18845 [Acidobacteria bacterium Mor1]|nr:hypothetical protein ABI59_18845 [Acidobacteria bacterium Mor1]
MTTPRKLRLMHTVHVLGLGGMEYGVIKQVHRLDPERFEPMICALWFQEESTKPLIEPRIPVFTLDKGESFNPPSILKLARLMREQKVDVVHSHNLPTYFHTIAAAMLAGVPVVVHGEHGRESKELPWHRALLSRWMARRVDKLTTVSEDLGRELVTRWGVRPERVRPVPNGVDLERMGAGYDTAALREEFGFDADAPVVLNIGRLRPVKDHPTLLRAFAKVLQHVPRARLLLVGSSHLESDLDVVRGLVDELGLESSVTFTGIRHDAPQLLELSDVYVNSSVYEGMSNTILEAMASRRPVVATDVGGNSELVQDGTTGYLVPSKNPDAMAGRILELLQDDSLRTRLGQGGRRRVERRHAMSKMVGSYAEVYREGLERKRLRKRKGMRERVKSLIARTVNLGGKLSKAPANRLSILTYHRVLPLPEAGEYPFPAMVMAKDHFEAQMAHLAREYNVLPLDEAVDRLRAGDLPPRAVAITFDDGYRDNLEHALPAMERYGLPSTLFVVTDVVTRGERLWWDDVHAALGASTQNGFDPAALPERLRDTVAAVREGAGAAAKTAELVYAMNDFPRGERSELLAAIRRMPGATADVEPLMMDWEELDEMRQGGVTLGGHTMSHAFLDELDESAARQEIGGCLEILRDKLEEPVRTFSYPRGRMIESVKPLLRDAGIDVAVTTEPGINGSDADPLALNRVDSGYFRSHGDFDPHVFDAEVTGRISRFR